MTKDIEKLIEKYLVEKGYEVRCVFIETDESELSEKSQLAIHTKLYIRARKL